MDWRRTGRGTAALEQKGQGEREGENKSSLGEWLFFRSEKSKPPARSGVYRSQEPMFLDELMEVDLFGGSRQSNQTRRCFWPDSLSS